MAFARPASIPFVGIFGAVAGLGIGLSMATGVHASPLGSGSVDGLAHEVSKPVLANSCFAGLIEHPHAARIADNTVHLIWVPKKVHVSQIKFDLGASGVIVAGTDHGMGNRILTAAHVANPPIPSEERAGKDLLVVLSDGTLIGRARPLHVGVYKGRDKKFRPADDLAVLEVEEFHGEARLSYFHLPGLKLASGAYPALLVGRTEGVVGLDQGGSGGPAVDANGDVVGVASLARHRKDEAKVEVELVSIEHLFRQRIGPILVDKVQPQSVAVITTAGHPDVLAALGLSGSLMARTASTEGAFRLDVVGYTMGGCVPVKMTGYAHDSEGAEASMVQMIQTDVDGSRRRVLPMQDAPSHQVAEMPR